MDIRLTLAELSLAAKVGVQRHLSALQAGRKDRYGASPEGGWALHIEGAAGEMAVAKALGRYWSGNYNDLAADDVGVLQVRTTSYEKSRLILHPSDPDDRPFILVIGAAPQFRLCGWIVARDGKRQEWWDDPTGKGRWAFWVPQKDLIPIDRLKAKEMA